MSTDPDVSITRAEEQLLVGATWITTGRARVSRRVRTFTETRTFDLRREEIVVEYLDDAEAGERSAERPRQEPIVMVLQTEEIEAVTTRIVPYERATVTTGLVTEHQAVEGTLLREQIDLEHDRPGPLTPDPNRTGDHP